MSEVEGLLPEPAFRQWVADRLPGTGPFNVERITSGMSHELFRVSRSGTAFVVRRPPRVIHAAVSSRSLQREFTVMHALEGTPVPHARPFFLCEDDSVLGAPFLVMEEIHGVRLYDELPPAFQAPETKRQVAESIVDALASIHQVAWETVGLRDFGRPDNFTERQVERWLNQLRSFGFRSFEGLDATEQWLRDHVPTTQRTTLIHGDYGLHNVLYPYEPGPPLAVVDWETATIGDPLMDVGYFMSMWLDRAEAERWYASALPYDVGGFPPRQDLIERYEQATGLSLADLNWYCAVAQIKMAAMLEGNFGRSLSGKDDNPLLNSLEKDVPNHVDFARHWAGR